MYLEGGGQGHRIDIVEPRDAGMCGEVAATLGEYTMPSCVRHSPCGPPEVCGTRTTSRTTIVDQTVPPGVRDSCSVRLRFVSCS